MKASILTIGDELLIGQTIDTNSIWISKQLESLGIELIYKCTLSDRFDSILQGLTEACSKSDIVITTGGLGPTKDDITKQALCDFFQTKLTHNLSVENWVIEIFNSRNIQMPQSNLAQAMLPTNCEVLWNRVGTAPGMWFTEANKTIISLPGVPHEMKTIFSEEAIPRIKERFELKHILHHYIQTLSIGESKLAEMISSVEEKLPQHIRLAYLPSLGSVVLRLSGVSENETTLEIELKNYAQEIIACIGQYFLCESSLGILHFVHTLLKEKNISLSVAESCTGGYVAHQLMSLSGSSVYFKGGIVVYSNESKQNLLNVPKEILDNEGAVSKACVEYMAKSCAEKFKSDFSIATSGIAGPDGGSKDKPVGTICIAWYYKGKTKSIQTIIKEERERFFIRATQKILDIIRLEIQAT